MGKPGELQSMGLQRIGHNWLTEQQLASEVPDWLLPPQGASGLKEQPAPESLLSASWEDQPSRVSIRTRPQQLHVSEIENIRSNELVLCVKIIHEPWSALLCWWLYYILNLQLSSKTGLEETLSALLPCWLTVWMCREGLNLREKPTLFSLRFTVFAWPIGAFLGLVF